MRRFYTQCTTSIGGKNVNLDSGIQQTMRRNRYMGCIFLVLMGAAVAARGEQQPAKDQVGVVMRNILYHYTDRVSVHILQLRGSLIPTRPGAIPVFDDKRSFVLNLSSAEIAIKTADIANVLNDYVFSGSDAPLKKISVASQGNTLKIKGQLHSKGDIPFEADGELSPTAEGKIRIHIEKVKAAHVPVKGLMDLVGIETSDLIKNKKVSGIQPEGNDLILDPQQILPLPRVQGRVKDVRLKGSEIVQTFGDKAAATAHPAHAGNYMAYDGAKLKFGKLIMEDADMVIIDMDPRDPFDFYLDHYIEQLVAGYTKITPGFGLRVFMRDYNKLRKSSQSKPQPRRP